MTFFKISFRFLVIFFLTLIFAGGNAFGEENEIFKKANQSYISGNYSDAIKKYSELLSEKGQTSELLYNLGNAYYKSGEIGKAVLNLEKALFLSPGNADISKNLEAIRKNSGLIIKELPFWNRSIESLNLNQWCIISSIVFTVICLLVFVRRLSFIKANPRLITVALYSLSVILVILVCAAYTASDKVNDAVVVVDSNIWISPFEGAEQTGTLKQGRIVDVINDHSEYFYIVDGEKVSGWVLKSELGMILDTE